MGKAITLAYGDGIGPEIMDAVVRILKEAKANVSFESIEIGESLYKKGYSSGISNEAWDSIDRTKIILKAPITTPQGGGYKSLNVTLRKALGLFANIRPFSAYYPYVHTYYPDMDVVIIRENEEDLYAGIEYRQTLNTYQTLKLVSRTGCEKIIRFAFEYAIKHNRKKVTCFSKDNIMKFTDGIFHKVFNEIAPMYPNIESNHMIIDIGSAKLAARPEDFDVIVTSNLYGDIISDIAAEVCGSVGMAGSANIGKDYALFEAIHGSAPDIAGRNIANPSGLLNAAIMMLVHINQPKVAETIQNAWLTTIEEGYHTSDIYNPSHSKAKLGTREFADEVIKRLGDKPKNMKIAKFGNSTKDDLHEPQEERVITINTNNRKKLVGVDVYIDKITSKPEEIANKINEICKGKLRLQVISSKGLILWPESHSLNREVSDHWRCRFVPLGEDKTASHEDIIEVLKAIKDADFDFIKTENLYIFNDDELGFSLSQGE